MINEILYNYGLMAEEIKKTKNGFQFYIDYDKYLLECTTATEKDIENIIILSREFNKKYFKIIPTTKGKNMSKINDIYYVLLKVEVPFNNEITIIDILNNLIPIEKSGNILDRTNWDYLWSSKVDYLEYQVVELAKNHPIVRSSFNYYVGLAENAIEYFNTIKLEKKSVFLSHKRIKYPNISLDYYNPLNLVIDYKVRDIAEYIKSYFFNTDKFDNKIIDFVLDGNYNFSSIDYNLLFARLLYPSYYFDEITNILEHNKDEDSLLRYINLASKYEIFLKKCLEDFSRHSNMVKIDWLL